MLFLCSWAICTSIIFILLALGIYKGIINKNREDSIDFVSIFVLSGSLGLFVGIGLWGILKIAFLGLCRM